MPDSALDIVQRASPYREGLRGYLDRGLAMLTGDRQKAEILTDIGDLTPVGNMTAANELPGAIRDAVQHPGAQSALAAGLTAASLLPFAGGLRRGAQTFSKDAGRTAHIFAGTWAKGADKNALEQFKQMDELGVRPAASWAETGWGKNKAGQHHWEIDDSASKYTRPVSIPGLEDIFPIKQVLDHPEFYKNYPDMGKMLVHIKDMGENQRAALNPLSGQIQLSSRIASDPKKARSAILHELQHMVQFEERFPQGGNSRQIMENFKNGEKSVELMKDPNFVHQYDPKDQESIREFARIYQEGIKHPKKYRDYELYKRLTGEVQARNTQTRMDWSAARRRAEGPATSQDVPYDEQIMQDNRGNPIPPIY